MTKATITYWPDGAAGFQTDLCTSAGSELSVAGRVDDDTPVTFGHRELDRNQALVMNLWAYSKHEHWYRRSRAEDKKKSHRREADRHADVARRLGDYVAAMGTVSGQAWCSCCWAFTRHTQVDGTGVVRRVYLCEGCGAPTTPCPAPRCRNMASRGFGAAKLPHYCAEHRHEIPSFSKSQGTIASLDDVGDWFTFDKKDLGKATRIATVAGVVAVIAAPAALVAAPAVGAALGASTLGGGLSGAAAVSHGLAMLGGGSLAAGGLGMVGGTAVIVATGTALGGGMGAVTATAYVGDDKSFRIQALREGSGTAVLFASGFLSEGEDDWGSWERIISHRYPDAPVYRVHWGSKELRAFRALATSGAGKAAAARAVASMAARGSAKAARKVPGVGWALVGHDVAMNPWSRALSRSIKTGGLLADILTRTEVDSVVLVGHSLGARVMAVTAQTLGTRPGAPKLETVHLLGAALAAKDDWRALSNSVSDLVWNYHSTNDLVLKGLYRSVQLGQQAAGVKGFTTSFPRIKNVDVSSKVQGHSDYFEAIDLR